MNKINNFIIIMIFSSFLVSTSTLSADEQFRRRYAEAIGNLYCGNPENTASQESIAEFLSALNQKNPIFFHQFFDFIVKKTNQIDIDLVQILLNKKLIQADGSLSENLTQVCNFIKIIFNDYNKENKKCCDCCGGCLIFWCKENRVLKFTSYNVIQIINTIATNKRASRASNAALIDIDTILDKLSGRIID